MTWINEIELWYAQAEHAMGWPTGAVVRLVLAAVLGGLIGLEREHDGHEAGFRTYALVCLGCAITMVVSVGFARVDWWADYVGGESIRIDPARVAYGVMGGIGFLGAGSIVQARGHVRGLTTAAGIWCAAAVGLSAGLGQLVPAVAGTLLVMVFLYLLDPVSRLLPRGRVALVTLRINGQTDAAIRTLRDSGVAAGLTVRHIDVDEVDLEAGELVVTALVNCSHADLLERVLKIVRGHERWELTRLKWVAD